MVKSKTSLPIPQLCSPCLEVTMVTDLFCDFPLPPFFFLTTKGSLHYTLLCTFSVNCVCL